MKKIQAILILFVLSACSASNVDSIKQNADRTWKGAGYEIVGYEGYQYGTMGQWGGCVWYTVKRNSVTYDGCIAKWGDEYHIYSLHALDAITP